MEESELKKAFQTILPTLTPREQQVISLRFGLEEGLERGYKEIGQVLDVSPERVRQIEAKALRKLRHPIRAAKLKEFAENNLGVEWY